MNNTPILAAIPLLLLAASAQATILYDGSTTPTTRLDQSPWGWIGAGVPDSTTAEVFSESAAAGVTTLNTTQAAVVSPPPVNYTGIKAGFVNTSATLNPSAGYKLDFNVAVTSETAGDPSVHSDTADRAGFSVIAISSNLQGVELAFWQNQIWAQSATFTGQATTLEKALVSTTAMHAYELTVSGSNYSLTQDGNFLFGGALKTYPALPLPATYAVPNSIFLGDDTTSRSATTNIAFVALSPIPVPEPASLVLLAAGIGALLRRRRG